MNSIIEAQITLKEEQEKEIEKCKNPLYFYENYILIQSKDGFLVKPTITDTIRHVLNSNINLIPHRK